MGISGLSPPALRVWVAPCCRKTTCTLPWDKKNDLRSLRERYSKGSAKKCSCTDTLIRRTWLYKVLYLAAPPLFLSNQGAKAKAVQLRNRKNNELSTGPQKLNAALVYSLVLATNKTDAAPLPQRRRNGSFIVPQKEAYSASEKRLLQ